MNVSHRCSRNSCRIMRKTSRLWREVSGLTNVIDGYVEDQMSRSYLLAGWSVEGVYSGASRTLPC